MFHSRNDTVDNLLDQLPISKTGEFAFCIPTEELTMENIVFWQCLCEHIKRIDENGDDEDDRFHDAICELSVFIDYLTTFIDHCNQVATTVDPGSWDVEENQYKLLLLVEILMKFDLGDEIGRQHLKAFLTNVLTTQTLNKTIIEKLIQCIEVVIPDLNDRTQYCSDLIRQIIEPNALVDICDASVTELLADVRDARTKDKLNQLKIHIIELQERERDADNENDLDDITQELHECREQFANLLQANTSLNQNQSDTSITSTLNPKKLSTDWIIHCLDIFFYTMCSAKTKRMTPNLRELYDGFIQRHMRSKCMDTRNRALRCGIVSAMLNDRLAGDIYDKLYKQMLHHHNVIVWESSITGLFELLDKYGPDTFASPDVSIDGVFEEDNNPVMELMIMLLDTCEILKILVATIKGLCRLVLSGRNKKSDVVVKLLLRFFDQTTEPEISQVLSVFMNTLFERKRQACLQEALLPTVLHILNDGGQFETPVSVIEFIINATAQENNRKEMHTEIARTFLNHMLENVDDKITLKLFSDPLPNLGIDSSDLVRNELKELAQRLLDEPIHNKLIEAKIKKFIKLLVDSSHNSSDQSHQSLQTEQSNGSPQPEQSQLSPELEVSLQSGPSGLSTATHQQQSQHIPPIEESPQPGPSGLATSTHQQRYDTSDDSFFDD